MNVYKHQQKTGSFLRALLTAAACVVAFGMTQSYADEPRLNAGGSTFIYPVMSKWMHEYDTAKHVQVNYQSVGSGGGIQQMTVKTFDFGCTDGAMNDEQLKRASETGGAVAHIPLVMGAVVPTYNLPSVKEELRFSGPVLAGIFLGKITKWNDPALQALNPGVKLPDEEIAVMHRSDGSGTTYIWVDYLAKVSPDWKSKVGVGTSVNWPAGEGQKGNEGVAGEVQRTEGAIGYIEFIYAMQNKMQFGAVQNKEGVFVKATPESVTAAANSALATIPDDLRYSITDAPGKDSYPISGTSWAVIYVNEPAGKGQEVVDFLRWVIHDGQKYADALHYAKLPQGLVARADKKLDSIKVAK
jgi:phosphate transport system substrate-binding protein